jgi:hypothetical protein
MLYEYCPARGVAHQRLGKLVVATSEKQARWSDACNPAWSPSIIGHRSMMLPV